MFIHILNAFEGIPINADNQQGSLKILKTPQRLNAENLASRSDAMACIIPSARCSGAIGSRAVSGKSWPSLRDP